MDRNEGVTAVRAGRFGSSIEVDTMGIDNDGPSDEEVSATSSQQQQQP